MPKAAGALWIVALAVIACRHTPSDKERQAAEIYYDLGIQAQNNGDPQTAFKEYQRAIDLDPEFAEAHNAIALLLHHSFKRHDEAIKHYKRAIELRATFSEAKSNLATVYLDLQRYDEAISLCREVLNDMLYPTPYIAENNLGWAYYKKGDVKRALEHIKAAVTTNPKFCLGFRNLGIIYSDVGQYDDACRQFANFREACPDRADAYRHEGMCLVRLGQPAQAKERFDTCHSKAADINLKDECRRLSEKLQ